MQAPGGCPVWMRPSLAHPFIFAPDWLCVHAWALITACRLTLPISWGPAGLMHYQMNTHFCDYYTSVLKSDIFIIHSPEM